MARKDLESYKKQVKELEHKNDRLQLENELQKQKDNLLDKRMKDFDLKLNELQKETSQKLKNKDARSVLKKVTINFVIGNQTNTAITWKKNQISGSEIHANNKSQNIPSRAKTGVGKERPGPVKTKINNYPSKYITLTGEMYTTYSDSQKSESVGCFLQ